MDTSGKRRRRWTVEVKRQIVGESFAGDSSVAQLAQKYAVNANQIFKWRKDYREAGLQNSHSINLLPVTVSSEIIVPAANRHHPSCQTAAGILQIELPKGNLRIAGSVDLTVFDGNIIVKFHDLLWYYPASARESPPRLERQIRLLQVHSA